jgi:hypothetical protein
VARVLSGGRYTLGPELEQFEREFARYLHVRNVIGVADGTRAIVLALRVLGVKPPPTRIYNRFVRWARRGIWENLFMELARNGRSTDTHMIDSTHVKAQLGSGWKRREEKQARSP